MIYLFYTLNMATFLSENTDDSSHILLRIGNAEMQPPIFMGKGKII